MTLREEVLEELEDLLQIGDIKACMVTGEGLEGIVPQENSIEEIDLWKLIKRTTDDFFPIISRFYEYDLTLTAENAPGF